MACFLGGMIAVILSIPTEQWLATLTNDQNTRYLLWAAAEEILKFVMIAGVALHTRYNDEPIDAMIYAIAVALGFAALENTLFVMGAMNSGGGLATSLVTGNMRFVGATLVHVVSSSLIGFSLGFSFYRGRLATFLTWVVGMSAAIFLHTSFNLAISSASSSSALRIFGWVWGAVVIVIVLFEEVKAVRPKLAS